MVKSAPQPVVPQNRVGQPASKPNGQPEQQAASTAGNSRKEILAKLMAGQISEDHADELLAALENTPQTNLHLYIGPKGTVCLGGVQRRPVTLYPAQWVRVLDFADNIRAFIKQWLGKPYTRKAKDENGVERTYTVTISMDRRG